ncbi:MAG: hypothetical protein MI974_02395 [Chitinophagales bacterium]|nr:hypothetical protein [Chitinophagales bacterium]
MKSRLSTIVFLLVSLASYAQKSFFDQPAFIISVYNHSVGIPFKDYVKTPLNFGFALGVEFSYPGKSYGKQFQKVEVGFYHHQNLHSALWVKTDFIRRFITDDGLFGEVQFGMGYMREYNAYQTFELTTDGTYKSKDRSSTGAFLAGTGIGGGYQFNVADKYNIAPFLKYEGLLQLPYSKLQPFFPHTLIHLGSRFQFID